MQEMPYGGIRRSGVLCRPVAPVDHGGDERNSGAQGDVFRFSSMACVTSFRSSGYSAAPHDHALKLKPFPPDELLTIVDLDFWNRFARRLRSLITSSFFGGLPPETNPAIAWRARLGAGSAFGRWTSGKHGGNTRVCAKRIVKGYGREPLHQQKQTQPRAGSGGCVGPQSLSCPCTA